MLDGASTKILLPQEPDVSDNVTAQQQFDRIRCYFGEPTPIAGEDQPDQHLKAPNPGKLFFISPPPSPPCGWEIREEDPPNKDTHAEDLERALATLGGGGGSSCGGDANEIGHGRADLDDSSTGREEGLTGGDHSEEDIEGRRLKNRPRTTSTTVYHPKDHGSSEHLPAVVVSDMSPEREHEGDMADGMITGVGAKGVTTHTSRPPVELMEE